MPNPTIQRSPDDPMPGHRFRAVVTARAAALAAVLVATIGMVACGSDDGGSTDAAGSLVERGGEVYAESCASCHGADLRGTDKGPSHLSVFYEPGHHTDDSFRRAIADGAPQHHWTFGDMPAVEGLTDDDVDAVIAFIRTEQERQGFEP